MPSLQVTDIAHRLFSRNKKAGKKGQETPGPMTNQKPVDSGSSCYSKGYPPTDSIVSPVSFDSDGYPRPESFLGTIAGGGDSAWGDSDEEPPHGEKVEPGVKQAEAVAAAWSKKALVCAYIG